MKNKKTRMSGILVHPTSFPSPYGIGDLGQSAYDFIDFLKASGQTLWQVLPLGPTSYGDSPYQSFSAFAGQPLIISPDLLRKDGLLSDEDLSDIPKWYPDKIDYGHVLYYKTRLFKKAFINFKQLLAEDRTLYDKYNLFVEDNSYWLKDYALFMSIKESYDGASWLTWIEKDKNPSDSDYAFLTEVHKSSIEYFYFLQYEFDLQWSKLKTYANNNDIYIVGDIPIFVSMDSSDAWANKNFFKLDSKGFPIEVAGVPPDYFSETGQLWGNPLYDWDVLKADNYSWWINRIRHQLKLVDYLRIDHFRGFESYWSVPYGEPTAINGKWNKCPGEDFFKTMEDVMGTDLPIFAEDLGVITPEVEKLRDEFNFPGMKILQFAFDSADDSTFLPHHYTRNSICYTGTHNNDTTRGWFNTVSDEAKEKMRIYLGSDLAEINWDFIRCAMGSTSRYAIIPLQDILSTDSSGRMNTPGQAAGNWQWRFRATALTDELAKRMKNYVKIFAR